MPGSWMDTTCWLILAGERLGTGRHRLTIACSGTFSTVARATRKSDGQQVAVKAIDKQLIDDSMDVNIEILVRGGGEEPSAKS